MNSSRSQVASAQKSTQTTMLKLRAKLEMTMLKLRAKLEMTMLKLRAKLQMTSWAVQRLRYGATGPCQVAWLHLLELASERALESKVRMCLTLQSWGGNKLHFGACKVEESTHLPLLKHRSRNPWWP